MDAVTLEDRVALLEAEMARLRRLHPTVALEKPWWEHVDGIFRDSPYFDEAVRLGRAYRESQRVSQTDPQPEAT